MKKALVLASLLLSPAWCAAPGLTFVDGSLYRENPDPSVDCGLRGAFTIRNDSGVELKNIRVTVHVMDGYGRPIFDHPVPEIRRMQTNQTETIPIFRPVYNGTVALFQLGADIDAEAAGARQHFVIPPHDAAAGYGPNDKSGDQAFKSRKHAGWP